MIQILLNSLISGLVLALVAYGFGLVFHVSKVFHLAQAGLFSVAGYVFLTFFSFNPTLAFIGSLIISVICAIIIERLVYFPLFRTNSNQIITLISSVGLNMILINILAIIFGSSSQIAEINTLESHSLGELLITQMQLIQTVTVILCLTATWLLLKVFKANLVITATSNNDYLVGIMGINVKKVRTLTIMLATVLIAIASMLITLDVGIDPYSGVSITLTGAVVAILTGRVDLITTILVSIVISLIQNTAEWFLSAQWKEGVTFVLLLFVMLWRTEGIVAYNLRKDLK